MTTLVTLAPITTSTPFFIFDVESVGLYGEGYAVAGGVFINGEKMRGFFFACDLAEAVGTPTDREWVCENIPPFPATHPTPRQVRTAFWSEWRTAKQLYPNLVMAGECIYPVETNFVATCIRDDEESRKWEGPYPFHEISSIMLAAGMDPHGTYTRIPGVETPVHHPLADTYLSARLLYTALRKLVIVD